MRFDRIETERLTVRRLTADDAEVIAAYRSLPKVARFQTSYTLDKARTLVREMAVSEPAQTGKWFQFGIELTSEHHLIGDIGFLNTDENKKSWIGFTLDPQYWRKGYGAEAVRAILDYYARIGVTSVWASTDPQNAASMKLLRTLGFALIEAKPDDMIFCFAKKI